MNKIDESTQNALLTLRNAGYYVDNLWHIDDVDNDDLTDEDKLYILHNAIHRDYIYERINEAIHDETEILTEIKNWNL
jgi:hypothetical protein